MATTPTNKPIPSEDPRDLKFNAGKIDEEVNGSADYYTDRFGVQRLTNTGRDNQFQNQMDQQADEWLTQFNQQQSDFQQFLLSSGYVFLGDYEDGPFQFSARNQYIRYNNQYYRLNAATDVGFTTTGTNATSFANDVTHFVLMDGDTLRQNLASSEEGMGGDLVAGNRYQTVRDIISRFKTYSDYGKTEPVYGFDTEFYADVFNDAPADNNLFLPGRLNLSSDLYGTSDRAVLLSLHGNEYHSFRSQIVSGDTVTLSKYNMAEDLLVYGGMQGKSSVTTTNPVYTTNTLKITDGADTSKVKTGSVIKTLDGYWAHVVSLLGTTITVTGWYKSGVAGVPVGASAYLNHVDKTYFGNEVMWIDENYTGTKVVGVEWDFMIDNPNVTEKNGWDMVLHQSSKYNMDTAFRVRSAAPGLGWNCAARIEDIAWAGLAFFTGNQGLTASEGSILESSGAVNGIKFMGYNKNNSLLFKYPGINTFPAALNPYGFWIKTGAVTASATTGVAINLSAFSYYVNNITSAFNLVLPSQSLTPGQEIHFDIFGVNAITVTCASSSVNVNGTTSYTYTPTKPYSTAHARWNGTSWNFFA
nr:MAG TPA: tail spike [Caudoviricetes sp.]